jgi:hypothetical protein
VTLGPKGAEFSLIRPLPVTQRYYLVGVRHCGDSRGNDWYSEVTALTLITDLLPYLGQGSF